MADWSLPTVDSDYEDFPTEVRNVAISAASMEYSSDTNIPDGLMRYNRSDKKFYQRESGIWVAKELTNLADDAVSTSKVQDSAISTAKIASNAITFAKIQNITSDRLMGRDTSGSGVPEEISVGGGLEFSGSTSIQRSALSGDVTASAGSNSTSIASNAVTTAKIADSNVTTAKIADSNVTTAKIADSNVTYAKLASDTATRSTHLCSFKASPSSSSAVFATRAQTSTTPYPMMRNGKITHISCMHEVGFTGLTSVTVYKNGSSTGISINYSNTDGTVQEFGTYIDFVHGDRISLLVSSIVSVYPQVIAIELLGYIAS